MVQFASRLIFSTHFKAPSSNTQRPENVWMAIHSLKHQKLWVKYKQNMHVPGKPHSSSLRWTDVLGCFSWQYSSMGDFSSLSASCAGKSRFRGPCNTGNLSCFTSQKRFPYSSKFFDVVSKITNLQYDLCYELDKGATSEMCSHH